MKLSSPQTKAFQLGGWGQKGACTDSDYLSTNVRKWVCVCIRVSVWVPLNVTTPLCLPLYLSLSPCHCHCLSLSVSMITITQTSGKWGLCVYIKVNDQRESSYRKIQAKVPKEEEFLKHKKFLYQIRATMLFNALQQNSKIPFCFIIIIIIDHNYRQI